METSQDHNNDDVGVGVVVGPKYDEPTDIFPINSLSFVDSDCIQTNLTSIW